MILGILKNGIDGTHEYWINSCISKGLEFDVIDLSRSDWLELIKNTHYYCFLACPPGRDSNYKIMYDEKIYIINNILDHCVYPNYNEISLHENKKFLSYWLVAHKLPHPKTYVFFNLNEATSFIKTCNLPIVGKINIGASGSGVKIFRIRTELKPYISKAFIKGLRREWGPNFKMGNYYSRFLNILKNPQIIINKFVLYSKIYHELQKGFIILQEYVTHDYEWRLVRIGDSYFGHQKVKQGDKASGTKGINYICPPDKLLTFVKDICDKYNFNSMAIDLFEDGKGGYLINEMQCIFGHVQTYICEKNGKPGRFRFINESWIFEEGMFNTNLSYDLRLDNVLSLVKNTNKLNAI
jgi:glutathione synthase/RimK-type ligase-like ATP-grasp enzyme